MIIINKSGYLKYKNLRFRCSLGKAGVGVKKREGDNITPKGTFKIIKIYYRKDKIKKIRTIFKLIKIEKNMGWCEANLLLKGQVDELLGRRRRRCERLLHKHRDFCGQSSLHGTIMIARSIHHYYRARPATGKSGPFRRYFYASQRTGASCPGQHPVRIVR